MDSEDIKRLVSGTGAVAVGIAATAPVGLDAESLYLQWIAAGKHGGMSYLEKYQDVRRDPRLLLEGAESIIVAAFNYYNRDNGKLRWARYALGRDYHEEIRERLDAVATAITVTTGAQCRVTVDTAPLRERYWAERAGVGFIGINNQLIVPGAGSWCVLGSIITTLPLDADTPSGRSCDGCMRCVRACPGRALDGKGGMDACKCLSYLTIEHRGEYEATPDRIYGCDVCQEVCPHNATAIPTEIGGFSPRAEILGLGCKDILEMEQSEFSRIFTHSAIKRTKLAGLQRNARMLNQGETQPE
ncbi:tRNA epoxyqueuosine(34) reductase QueG [Duncaniella freteri]|uniref:tRNA epoxyqueuosine(34) reductase QueG n=1 Tax=Duncaniella freteri TaxID=2530391 RepID=UPI0025533CFF|nr:tRNA epoxyqueuosine(34) reductase QueG [Duncaniella freteri]